MTRYSCFGVLGCLACAALCANCGSGNDETSTVAACLNCGGAPSGGADTNAGSPNAGAGGGSSDCPTSCDDGFSCTVDSCVAGACRHTIGPRTGVTACPAGQYCTIDKGCTAAPACSTVDQCVAAWKDDACKVNIACEAASSVCTFDLLDKDADDHPPQICGGDDCDDSSWDSNPGAPETCNGADDNCNGVVDEDHANMTIIPGTLEWNHEICGYTNTMVCTAGQCVCKPEYLCGTNCRNLNDDESNCGVCGNVCPSGTTCTAGVCL